MSRRIDRLVKAASVHTRQFEIAVAGLTETAQLLRDEALAHTEAANEHKTHASRAELAAWRMEEQAYKIGGLLK